jgi:hypothetical protein
VVGIFFLIGVFRSLQGDGAGLTTQQSTDIELAHRAVLDLPSESSSVLEDASTLSSTDMHLGVPINEQLEQANW